MRRLLPLLALVAGCGSPEPSLVGRWEGSQNGVPTTSEFRADGTYRTVSTVGAARITMDGTYTHQAPAVTMRATRIGAPGLPKEMLKAVQASVGAEHTATARFLGPDETEFAMNGAKATYRRAKS